jgi:hypothetical protein
VPKRPLSISASANWISGPSTGALLFGEGAGRPRAIFDRGHRTLLAELPEATTEDRTERTDAVWWCW